MSISSHPFRDRARLAAAIRSVRAAVAEEVTSEFLVRHPDWKERYGERARLRGTEDAAYHQDFLAAAIETGEVETFNEYGEWAARMLQARQIEPVFLAENLEQIGRALRARLTPQDADTVDAFIRSGVERCLQPGPKPVAPPSGALESLARMYVEAAIHGNRQAALNFVLEAARQGHPVIDLYADVLQSAMYRIGRMWEENRITVAQEHMATAITQFVIAQLYTLIEPAGTFRGGCVITGVEGELHQVGANLVADVLQADGWDVRFLGTNVPVGAVVEAVEEHQATLLGISATLLPHLPDVARLIEAVRAKASNTSRIMVGGAAFRAAPLLYKELGADGCGADLRSAVSLALELVTRDSRMARGATVLVVDDDAGVRKWVRRVLEDSGCQVMEAEDGDSAMIVLRQRSVSLVLMDLVMPGQEGLETIPRIKKEFPATSIIAMSGAFGGAFLNVAKALGARAALTKPMTPEALVSEVERALRD